MHPFYELELHELTSSPVLKHLYNDLLLIIDKGTEINSPTDFISWIGQPSGPGDLSLYKFITLSKTMSGVISMESTTGGESLEQTIGITEVSSVVKTLEKNSLKREAFSESEQTVEPLGLSISEILGRIFNLELMRCQKTFGLESMFCTR